ncbi:uncharacterized protein K02A2.6-like [Rhipicephalus sanguineus]|uniref:uncharacterized protein K02A2.6-like n=1 Tax=Rhipicephalus sanguineus TaxID=34632 RepID=UPI001895F7BC|nr:uncharacterized protein K02A2.6-like [Rhipicephalus sanguineus]
MDAHSKWVEVFVMTTTSEKTVEKLRGVFAAYGLPEEIVTDNGPQFTSQHFATFLSRNGIRHSKSPPYHPVSNGSTERCVQTVKKDLFKQILDEERKEDKKSMQHRNTPSSTTGETPAQILLSWQPRTRLSLLHPDMEQRMREKGEQAKLHADQKRGPWRDFWEGDQVLVKGLRPDHDKWLLGTIAQRCSACTYIVRVGDEDQYVHADNLRLRTFQENRSWLKAAGTVLDGPRVENKGPPFRDTREPTSTSTPTRLNDQDQPASNLTSPAAESAGPSTEPSPGLLHDSCPTLDTATPRDNQHRSFDVLLG